MGDQETPAKEIKRLNVNVPSDLKKRLGAFCAKEEMTIKDVVELSIESFLDAEEGKQ